MAYIMSLTMLKMRVKDILSLFFRKCLLTFVKKSWCNCQKSKGMIRKGIVGREYEQQLISECCNSGKAELIAVYGRRRVGKTYLVRQMFDNHFAFFFTGMYEANRAVQLEQFRINLQECSGTSVPKLKDWFAAFHALRQYLETLSGERQVVVFLDELPWMDTPKSNFLQAFGYFWNTWASTMNNLKLLVCGSATTWMLSNLIGDKGGLYGRVTRQIYLAPFSLAETGQFLNGVKGMAFDRQQVLRVYMIMGGIPYYLNMLERGMPLDASIDRLFFVQGAPLKGEFEFLFRSLFNDSKNYRRVVETLSTKMKGMTRKELVDALKMKAGGGMLTGVLENLRSCDFIRKYAAIGKSERDALYQLTDLFSLFHLRFVANNNGQDEHFWSNLRNDGSRNAWSGYAFEQVCFHHVRQIKKALGISGILSNVYSWSSQPFVDASGAKWKGGQVDMLIDRADGVINLCEVKYAHDEYAIDAAYAQRLRERESSFRVVTKTKKTLWHTFITTYGVKQNMYSGMVNNEVTVDELFESGSSQTAQPYL